METKVDAKATASPSDQHIYCSQRAPAADLHSHMRTIHSSFSNPLSFVNVEVPNLSIKHDHTSKPWMYSILPISTRTLRVVDPGRIVAFYSLGGLLALLGIQFIFIDPFILYAKLCSDSGENKTYSIESLASSRLQPGQGD